MLSENYATLRDNALNDLKAYLDSLDPSKGKKIAYWIRDYTRFLKQEQTFRPDKQINYKRGSIVKVHLGYRIGCEEGGLHYAIVMDRKNSIYNPTITVIPLTSIKENGNPSKIHPYRVSIGDEVYTLLRTNLNAEIQSAKQGLKEIQDIVNGNGNAANVDHYTERLTELTKQIEYCERMNREAERMKKGSIALVGQIVTVSKIRIYDPKYSKDALAKVRISAKTLDVLDAKVQELYGPLVQK